MIESKREGFEVFAIRHAADRFGNQTAIRLIESAHLGRLEADAVIKRETAERTGVRCAKCPIGPRRVARPHLGEETIFGNVPGRNWGSVHVAWVMNLIIRQTGGEMERIADLP